jgi:hypothetical protein
VQRRRVTGGDHLRQPTSIIGEGGASRGASRGAAWLEVLGHGRKAQSSQSTGDRVSGHAISFDPRLVLRAAAQSHGHRSSASKLKISGPLYSCGRSSMKGARASSSMAKPLCCPLILARRPGIDETTTL